MPPAGGADADGSEAAVTDSSPTPPNRRDPQLDPPDDAEEPAFDWMRPGTPETPAAGSAPADDTGAGSTRQPRSRAGRKAAEGAVDPDSGDGTHFTEPLPTAALQIRPPEEEVQRRYAEREHALNAKPMAPRVMQVLLAVCFPVILLVLAVRTVASPLFLWVEYNRPGFPGDGYGFSTDDRMTYGSYAVDYLSNWAGPRYLGELVDRSGDKLFGEGEVSHMADVKLVILSAFGAGVLLILLSLAAVLYLRRRSPGGVRRGLFAGSLIALTIIVSLGVLAVLGWEQFFAQFHSVFFASGTWTFALQDTLIRLFPAQFWVDGGIVIAALVLLTSLLTLILTWPTRKRRGLPKRGAAAVDPSAEATNAVSARDRAGNSLAADENRAGVPAKRSRFRRFRAGQGPAAAADGSGPAPAADGPAPGPTAVEGTGPESSESGARGSAGSSTVGTGTPDAGTPGAGTPGAGTPDAGTPDRKSPGSGSAGTATRGHSSSV